MHFHHSGGNIISTSPQLAEVAIVDPLHSVPPCKTEPAAPAFPPISSCITWYIQEMCAACIFKLFPPWGLAFWLLCRCPSPRRDSLALCRNKAPDVRPTDRLLGFKVYALACRGMDALLCLYSEYHLILSVEFRPFQDCEWVYRCFSMGLKIFGKV